MLGKKKQINKQSQTGYKTDKARQELEQIVKQSQAGYDTKMLDRNKTNKQRKLGTKNEQTNRRGRKNQTNEAKYEENKQSNKGKKKTNKQRNH